MLMYKKILCYALLLILFFSLKTFAQSYGVSDVFSPNTFPYVTELVPCTDGSTKLYVVTQRGKIWIVNTSNPSAAPKLFLDMSDVVSQNEPETGLLGLTFHPNYSINKLLYISYTKTTGGQLTSYISKFNVSPSNPDSVLRSSEINLISLDQPYENHNGGKIAFGPDNFLYISFGDGGSGGDPGNRAQDKSLIFGKILRIDVNSVSAGRQYSIPVTNPYFNNVLGYREEIYAYGLRNVWKFSFDSQNGKLWCGDVGQDLYEEIDTISNGRNYGWRIMEGFHCYDPANGCDTTGLTLPLFEYSHNGTGFSITGGYIFRGNYMPGLYGKYIFGDFSLGKIWALNANGISDTSRIVNLDAPCSTFGVDNQKNIYACSYSLTGKILKIFDTGVGIDDLSNTPKEFELKQNYPNPFNPSTKIEFIISRSSLVSLKVYDINGKLVSILINNKNLDEGKHTIEFYSEKLSSGIYFYKLTTGEFNETRRMVIIK